MTYWAVKRLGGRKNQRLVARLRVLASAGTVALVVAFLACQQQLAPNDTEGPAATVLTLNVGDSLVIGLGATVQLEATPRDAAGQPVAGYIVTWSTSNSSVVNVDGSGALTAIGMGTAAVTAAAEKAGAPGQLTRNVNVIVAPEPVATVEVVPDQATIPVGGSIRLTAILRDAAGNELRDRAVSWSSNDDAIATVDQGGNVFGQGPGLAAITASSEGRSGNAAVTVETPSPVVDVAVWPPGVDAESGQRVQFYAAALQADRTVTCIPESPSQDPNVLFNANVVAGCDSATALLDFSKANGTSTSVATRPGGASRLTLPVGIGAN